MTDLPEPQETPVAHDAFRVLADDIVQRHADLSPDIAAWVGLSVAGDQSTDLSPESRAVWDAMLRTALADVEELQRRYAGELERDVAGQRLALLLHERLDADLALGHDGEYLREVMNTFGVKERVLDTFEQMPSETAEEIEIIADRLDGVGRTLQGLRHSLDLHAGQPDGFLAAPRQADIIRGQIDSWTADGQNWYAEFVDRIAAEGALGRRISAAALGAHHALEEFGAWLTDDYRRDAAAMPDGVGTERYARWNRLWNGSDSDLAELHDWGWHQIRTHWAEMEREADQVAHGATPEEAARHLDESGERVAVSDLAQRMAAEVRRATQRLNDHVLDVPPSLDNLEIQIAERGSAAAPYYVRPTRNGRRPGRVFFPVSGEDPVPVWRLISACMHEGIPGHHLQLGGWILGDGMSLFESSLGTIDATTEGWAMYAEHLADRVGLLDQPGARLGFLQWQMVRSLRLVVDIGLHIGAEVPIFSRVHAGAPLTAEIACAVMLAYSSQPRDYVISEVGRYLGLPAQALSYKIGERAWLDGYAAAEDRARGQGRSLDLKEWHRQSLALPPLPLDALVGVLSDLPIRSGGVDPGTS